MEPALPLKSAIRNEKWGKETMKYENAGQMNFFSEMAEHQISAREFFSNVLLDSLDRNFGLKHVLISYFDTH